MTRGSDVLAHPDLGAAHNVRGVESFGPLLAFELYRIALVQCLIPILLNSREVYEHVLTSGTLDKPVSFSSVEPLDHAIFLQANSLSDSFHHHTLERYTSSRRHKDGKPGFTWMVEER